MRSNYENLLEINFIQFFKLPHPLKNREFPKTSIQNLLDFIRKNEVQILNQHPQIHHNSYITTQVTDPP